MIQRFNIIPGIFPRYFFMHFYAREIYARFCICFYSRFMAVFSVFLCYLVLVYTNDKKRFKNDLNASMLHTEQMHPAPARRIATRAAPLAAGTRSGGIKKPAHFSSGIFLKSFLYSPSRARLALKVAKAFKSRYSRVKKSPADARKSRSRTR
jgi:hypothetical protein